MSRNDWEEGTLTLPTAAVGPLRKALRDAANAYHAAVLAECLRLWNGPLAKTTSSKVFIDRMTTYGRQISAENEVRTTAYRVMFDIVGGERFHTKTPARNPRTPRAADVERYAPKATVRTVTFGGPADEWQIHFAGSKLQYRSGHNNRAVERARRHPVVAVMFRSLERIHWTRATGGVLVGNDEYNQDARDSGGGGNYITKDYGPLGSAERAFQMGMSVERYRKLMGGAHGSARR